MNSWKALHQRKIYRRPLCPRFYILYPERRISRSVELLLFAKVMREMADDSGSWTLYSDLKEKSFLLRFDIDSECSEATTTQEKNWYVLSQWELQRTYGMPQNLIIACVGDLNTAYQAVVIGLKCQWLVEHCLVNCFIAWDGK